MEQDTIAKTLREKLEIVSEALRRSEARALAGHLALETLHEIRNPLEALNYFNYLIREDADNPFKVRHWTDMAEEQMWTMNKIASQTLSYARTSSSPRFVDLVAIAHAAVRIHQRKMDLRKLRLVRDLPEELLAEVHAGEILQVLSNLIVNALEALPSDGTLSLRLSKRSGKARLLVADNGPGIPKEHHQRIFESHYSTKGDLGTGLGLALTRRIVERHGGNTRLKSCTKPGQSGSVFQVSLPL